MKFLTKRDYKEGWFLVKPIVDNVKYEVIIYDGVNTYCENVSCISRSAAEDHCKNRIDSAYGRIK